MLDHYQFVMNNNIDYKTFLPKINLKNLINRKINGKKIKNFIANLKIKINNF